MPTVRPMARVTVLESGWELACARWLEPSARVGRSAPGWLPAEVPGHVHADLLRHGLIADPCTALGELGCQWVDEEAFVYRTALVIAPDPELPRRVLRFEGLDTIASVTLDGAELARHDDMFVPLEIDLTDRAPAGTHRLEVRLEPAARVGRERRARYLADAGLPPTVRHFDERAFVRKAQYMFGWDFAPRLVSAGIWRPVTLIEHAGRIRDVHAMQRHHEDGSVTLTLRSDVEGDGICWHRVVGPGVDAVVADGAPLRLVAPERWWPAGLGRPCLYTVTTLLVPPGTPGDVDLTAVARDQRTLRVGVRRVELLREPDRWGESFELRVNGERLWAFGANWVPLDSLPSRVTRARLRPRLEQARALGMNTLRVWGGGLYESDDFYDLCDELGLLVWQDFAFACSHVPDDAAACAAVRAEAAAVVRRLRNHPSLALWCGNNENAAMFHERWGGADGHPPRLHGAILYDEVLPQVVAALDPGRPYLRGSPTGGARPNDGGAGDQHCWDVWHGRGDYRHYDDSTARFASEFGFAAAPGARAWRAALGDGRDPAALAPDDLVVRWHDKTGKPPAELSRLLALHYPAARTLADLSFTSRLNQRDALRHGIEHFRRSEYCRGALVWQLGDCWPALSWAVIDWLGELKPAARELERLFAPLLLSIVIAPGRAEIHAVLDHAPAPIEGELTVEARALADGRTLARWAVPLRVSPGQRRPVLEADTSRWDRDATLLTASLLDQRTTRLLGEPKDARLSAPRLTAWSLPGALVLESDRPVIDLCFEDGDALGLQDDCVTLPGPGRVRLRATGVAPILRARSLQGPHAIPVHPAPDDDPTGD